MSEPQENSSPDVAIDIQARQLSLRNVTADELGGFHAIAPQVHRTATGETIVQRSLVSLCESPDGYCVPNAGLGEAAAYRARELGMNVIRAPDLSGGLRNPIVSRAGVQNLAAVEFVANQRHGLVRYGGDTSAIALCVDIARSLLSSRIIFVSRHRERRMSLARNLRMVDLACHVADHSQALTDNALEEHRIVVCSFPNSVNHDYQTSDLVVFLDAMECRRNDAMQMLEPVDGEYNLIGLISSGTRIPQSMQDWLPAIYGTRIVDVPCSGFVRRPTNVARIKLSMPKMVVSGESTNRQKLNRLVWRNQARNRQIADVAERLAAGRTSGVCNKRPLRTWMNASPGDKRIIVATQNERHAVRLARKISDARLDISDAPDQSVLERMGISGSDHEHLLQQMTADPVGTRITISTVQRVNRMRHESLDVLIWAGGGETASRFLPAMLGGRYGSARPLLLVDFCDYFNATARGWSSKRSQGYRSAEVYAVGTDQNEGRRQDFERRQKKLRRASE